MEKIKQSAINEENWIIGNFKLTAKWIRETVSDYNLKIAKNAIEFLIKSPLADEIKAIIFLSMVEFLLKETDLKKITGKYTENILRGVEKTVLSSKALQIVDKSEIQKSFLNEIREEIRAEIRNNDEILKEVKEAYDLYDDNNLSDEDKQKIINRYEKGYTMTEIAKITKIEFGKVRRVVNNYKEEKKKTKSDKVALNTTEEKKRDNFAKDAADQAKDLSKNIATDLTKEEAKNIAKSLITKGEEVLPVVEETAVEAAPVVEEVAPAVIAI